MQAPLPVELQGQIGQRLREAYIELINEPVPDRFVALLQKLKQHEDKQLEEKSKEESRDEK
ncbi:NepR family anti-sigma factor [Hyphomicrobium sp. ghe19]|uniref:NepR family anti-sigma factor n=1 Tax=Hyphomicrobium sp. ghe19 TaxID=2682968 RepID=UPI0030CFFF2D